MKLSQRNMIMCCVIVAKAGMTSIKPLLRKFLLITAAFLAILAITHFRLISNTSHDGPLYKHPRYWLHVPRDRSHDTSSDKSDHIQSAPPNWRDQYWCDVNCTTGVPCEYKDEVDLRVLLLVFDRPDSLAKAFQSLSRLDMMGDRLSVDIWIDRHKDGYIHNETETMAARLVKSFSNGRACYHTQTHHAYIATQWIDTYRSKKNTHEVAIILEDDIDLSKYAWRWYKALHTHFKNADNIAGYSLKSESKTLRTPNRSGKPIAAPKTDTIVLYNCFQAWGYSPQPNVWRDFQDWYHTVRKDASPSDKRNKIDSIEPRVPGSLHAQWWYTFKKKNFQESMAHEMFNIYFTNIISPKPLFTVYQNLDVYTGRQIFLCKNRKEKGLHYSGGNSINSTEVLLNNWDENFVKFPEHPVMLNIKGDVVKNE